MKPFLVDCIVLVAAMAAAAVVPDIAVAQQPTQVPDAPPPALAPGAASTLIVRWIVEDGYYIDAEPASSVTLRAPAGVRVTPARVETAGRVLGGAEYETRITVAGDARPGRADLRGAVELFFCSIPEKWCKRVTRTTTVPLRVAAAGEAPTAPETIQLELLVPLDEER